MTPEPTIRKLPPGSSGLEDDAGGIRNAPRPKRTLNGKAGAPRAAPAADAPAKGSPEYKRAYMREWYAKNRAKKSGAGRAANGAGQKRASARPSPRATAKTPAPPKPGELMPSPERQKLYADAIVTLKAASDELGKELEGIEVVIAHLERLAG